MSEAPEITHKMFGELPTGWIRRRLRFDVRLNPRKSALACMCPAQLVSFVPMDAIGLYGGINLEDVRELYDVYDGYTYFADGDICIAKITPCFENGKIALAEGLENGIGFGTTELHVVRPHRNVDRRFLLYVLVADNFRKLGESEMYGAAGQKRLGERFIKDWRPPLPPLTTQRRIADFLDRETARIDRLVERKRRLTELLAERRQALVTHAVTGGLDPDAPAIDGDCRGAEGNGGVSEAIQKACQAYRDLPRDWDRRKLKFLANIRNSSVDKKTSEGEHPIRLCNYTDVYCNDQIAPDLDFMQGSATTSEIMRFQLKAGQVLITKDSESWDDIGIPALVSENMPDVLCGYHLSIFEPRRALDGGFLAWLCRSGPLNDQFKLAANGVTRFGIGQWAMKNAFIALPQITTQRRIASFLDRETARIDQIKERTLASINRLGEYRSAVITAAVTSQIDVATWAGAGQTGRRTHSKPEGRA